MKGRCVYFLTSLNQGGMETYLLRFLNYCKMENHSTVWCKSGIAGDLIDEYNKCTEKLVFKRLRYFSIIDYVYLYRWLKTCRPDVVFDCTGNFAGIVMFVAYMAGVENRIAYYAGSTNHFKETRGRLLYNAFVNKLVYRFATKILSNSRAAFDFFFPNHSSSKKYFKVIPNGIPDDFFNTDSSARERIRQELGIPESAFVVGHTGRYNVAKNHETIIKVAEELCHKYNEIYFVLAGKGTDEFLKSSVEAADLAEKVKLLGYRRDIKDLLDLFDLYYFPSITEGQPNALQEAMARGVPVLASDIAPIKECVPPEFVQKLLNPTDVAAASQRIEQLYLNRDWLKEYVLNDWARNMYSESERFKQMFREL